MRTAVIIDVGAGAHEAVSKAASFFCGFYPGAGASLHGDRVLLTSDRHSDEQLRQAWSALLTNELLRERSAAGRSAVLRALVE